MIAVERLTKKYGELTAVRDLSFQVEKGKIWGLLGPNAAGKTTTMRILTGFLPATDGQASVGGFDVFEQPNEVKKILGYLPEVLPLYPDMTVTEYLGFIAAIKQIPAAKRREAIAKAIKITGLETVKGRLIKNICRTLYSWSESMATMRLVKISVSTNSTDPTGPPFRNIRYKRTDVNTSWMIQELVLPVPVGEYNRAFIINQ